VYVVLKTGGKQYPVSEGLRLLIEKTDYVGDQLLELQGVAICQQGDESVVSARTILAQVVKPVRSPKVIVFKKKRRQNYRRKNGHRQDLLLVEIQKIQE
jgi:large subunit ribosomal protein L21